MSQKKLIKMNRNQSSEILIANSYLFPFLFSIVLIFSIIEIFSYPGFVRKVFFLPKNAYILVFYFSLLTTLISKIFLLHSRVASIPEETNLLLKFIKLLLLPTVIMYISFFILETKNFPNYVFSQYHIHLNEIKNLLYLFVITLAIFSPQLERLIKWAVKTQQLTLINIMRLSVPLLIGIYLLDSVSNIIDSSVANLVPIALNPWANYDQKMNIKYPVVYKYLSLVKENTPETASIAIPPQKNPWLTVGNPHISRYFLYPRTILKYENSEKADYIMIAKGSWIVTGDNSYGWPEENFEATEVSIFNLDTGEKQIMNSQQYIYQDNIYNWGLIKK